MKVVILAGGYGTRLSEETDHLPKPMIEIGGRPILWHIMKIYSYYGFNEFIILLGYKGYVIKEFFLNYYLHQSNVSIDLESNKLEILNNVSEPWKVTLLDTGLDTMTGGRIKQIKPYLDKEPFFLTYGDGVSNVNIKKLLAFHKKKKKKITVTGIKRDERYGILDVTKEDLVKGFKEKPKDTNDWINGGFFVCEPEVLDKLKSKKTVFEQDPLKNLANEKEMSVYKHNGFWQCMDTLRDKTYLEKLYDTNPPWKVW